MGLRSCVGQRFHCRVAQIVMHKRFSWIKAFAVPGCNEGSWSTSYWLSSWLREPPFAFSSGSSNHCWPPKDFSIHFATGIASIWMTPFFFLFCKWGQRRLERELAWVSVSPSAAVPSHWALYHREWRTVPSSYVTVRGQCFSEPVLTCTDWQRAFGNWAENWLLSQIEAVQMALPDESLRGHGQGTLASLPRLLKRSATAAQPPWHSFYRETDVLLAAVVQPEGPQTTRLVDLQVVHRFPWSEILVTNTFERYTPKLMVFLSPSSRVTD